MIISRHSKLTDIRVERKLLHPLDRHCMMLMMPSQMPCISARLNAVAPLYRLLHAVSQGVLSPEVA